MRVSHETIYQSLFVQGRGELRRELARCFRSGRTVRRSRGRVEAGPTAGMVMIPIDQPKSKTGPCQATGRAISFWARVAEARWELWSSAATRLVLLLHLARQLRRNVDAAMRKAFSTLPGLCSDRLGSGRRDGQRPTSPWRPESRSSFATPTRPGSGDQRKYQRSPTSIPAEGNGPHHRQPRPNYARSSAALNGPRKTLGFMTPLEKFAELVASTG